MQTPFDNVELAPVADEATVRASKARAAALLDLDATVRPFKAIAEIFDAASKRAGR